MLDFSKKYHFNEDFELRECSGKYIYVNFKTGDWLRTNECGRDILSGCNGDSSLDTIIDGCACRVNIPADVIKESCLEFLERTVNLGLIYYGASLPDVAIEEFHMSAPETIWIHVSARCNLHCPFCYSDSSSEKEDTLDPEKVLSFLEQTKEDQRDYIIISGGEPFLYAGLEALLAGIKSLGFKYVQLITNGTVGHERYKNVSRYVDKIQFSVDGTTAEINDITRGKGSFEKFLNGIYMANESDFKYKIISFTVSNKNVHQLPFVPRFAIEHNVDQINISRIVPVGRGKKVGFLTDDCKYGSYLNEFIKEYKKVIECGYNIRLSIAENISDKLTIQGRRRSCGLAESLLSISYNGKIYPCPSLHDDQFVIGSYTDSIEKIIENGQKINEKFSVDNKESDCFDCKYRYFCGGGCLAKKLACKDGTYCKKCMQEIDYLFEVVG